MAEVQPPGFPVSVRAAVLDVGGAPIDVVVSKYEDGLFLVASQIGAFGTVMRAKPDATAEGRALTYSTAVLLGRRDEPLLALAARQLVEAAVEAGNTRPLTLSLGLKEHSLAAIKQLVAGIKEQGLLR
ncbi:MAG: hypothetical protein J3K34DRAFT_445302 [Monoraphidium minutum]|nr:MAG: hypothetical protein J3K34DRAFT_445302 [Monoraphidium minutum]